MSSPSKITSPAPSKENQNQRKNDQNHSGPSNTMPRFLNFDAHEQDKDRILERAESSLRYTNIHMQNDESLPPIDQINERIRMIDVLLKPIKHSLVDLEKKRIEARDVLRDICSLGPAEENTIAAAMSMTGHSPPQRQEPVLVRQEQEELKRKKRVEIEAYIARLDSAISGLTHEALELGRAKCDLATAKRKLVVEGIFQEMADYEKWLGESFENRRKADKLKMETARIWHTLTATMAGMDLNIDEGKYEYYATPSGMDADAAMEE